jgi:hypothetical protein
MNTTTLALALLSASQSLELPDGLLSAVCFVESSHRVHIIRHNDGKGNSVGACQIKLNTAKLVGFKGTEAELQDPILNTYYAAKYLKKQLERYDWHLDKAIAAYNSGTYRAGKDTFALNQKYVDKVLQAWDEGR